MNAEGAVMMIHECHYEFLDKKRKLTLVECPVCGFQKVYHVIHSRGTWRYVLARGVGGEYRWVSIKEFLEQSRF